MPVSRALHAAGYVDSLGLTLVLLVAGLGAAFVLGLAIAALLRRRSTPYLLVALAVATILARTVVAGVALQGFLAPGSHHLLEHGLDVAMVALVIAAVYTARSGPPTTRDGDQ
jgi:peptidoglycan/LPS O-acetylase OafA/YrhL